MEKLGIEEVKAVVNCGLSVGELVDALADGVGLGDIGALVRAGKSVKPAIDAVKSGKIIPEIKDLDESEKAELKMWAGEEFDISNDDLEAKIEQGFNFGVDLLELVKGVA